MKNHPLKLFRCYKCFCVFALLLEDSLWECSACNDGKLQPIYAETYPPPFDGVRIFLQDCDK